MSPGRTRALLALARVAHETEEYERALALLKETLAVWAGGMAQLDKVHWLEAHAALAPHIGEAAQGARSLGTTAHARETMGTPLPPVERESHARAITDLSAALGEECFKALGREGQVVTVEQAIASIFGKWV